MASQQASCKPRTGAAARVDPACSTCRKKCRKCDRARPQCQRCVSKGLVCEGYPLSFKMYDAKPSATRHERAPPKGASTMTLAAPVLPKALLRDVQPSDTDQVHLLLKHYEDTICTALPTLPSYTPNPFRDYILPLASQHAGLLEAVLGLSACHMMNRNPKVNAHMFTAAIEHRLSAFSALGSLLLKEERSGLSDTEEEVALAIVLTLVLHDICDCGKSKYGAHLNGVAFLCSRIAGRGELQSPGKTFLVTALTWFDLLRGYSGAEKLAFTSATRRFVESEGGMVLNMLVGCPSEIFSIMGQALHAGKKFMLHSIDAQGCESLVEPLLGPLFSFDVAKGPYPNDDPEWHTLAEAYRHTAILRVLRVPDTYTISCADERVRASITAILDAIARIPRDSPYFKRFLFPLFVAGAETDVLHQQQYVSLCIDHIRDMTGFGYKSLDLLLEKTWEQRRIRMAHSTRNVPWYEFVSLDDGLCCSRHSCRWTLRTMNVTS